jgi:hypothetical protein
MMMTTTTTTPTKSAEHLSTFELDVYFASAPLSREVAVEEHVASCERCREYLEELDRVLLTDDASTLPSWLVEAPAAKTVAPAAPPASSRPSQFSSSSSSSASRPSQSRRLKQRLGSAAGVLALAACAVLYFSARTTKNDESYVGVKGSPAAQILLRRDSQVRVWDGVAPVRAGDAIAVDVACEQFKHVTVATVAAEENGGALTRAWEGECPRTSPSSPLPFTLVVDEQPGREHFSVVLHREQHLTDEQLRTALRASTRSSDVWTIDFAFAKEDR